MKKIVILLICASFLATGCENLGNESLMPDDIVASAIETNKNEEEYYMESTMTIFQNNEQTEEVVTKEWRAKVDGEFKRKSEVISKEERAISVQEGSKIYLYQETTNEYFVFDIEDGTNMDKSLKEQTMEELNLAKDMFDIRNMGEREVNGRETFYLKGEPEEESELLGDYEIWIDKENWVVVKSKSKSGDMEIVLENKEVDFSPDIDPSTFQLDIPEDAEIVDINKDAYGMEDLTLEEAGEKFHSKPLYIDEEGYEIEKLLFSSNDEELIPDELVFNYSKDGQNAFTVSVIEESEAENGELDELGLGEKREIRGSEGLVVEDLIDMVIFYEDGLQYNFILEENSINVEEVLETIENMVK